MSQHEELQRQIVGNARRTAIVFGVCSIVTLISVVFAFVSRIETERQSEIAIQNERRAKFATQESLRATDLVAELKKELETCRASQK
jgi:hypothetical protein